MIALVGALCALGAAAGWALASVYFTKGSDRFSVLSINFLKGAFAFPFFLLMLLWSPFNLWSVAESHPGDLGYLVLSALVGMTLGDTLILSCFVRVGPRITLVGMSLVPFFTSLMGYFVLGEKLTWVGGLGLLFTMMGLVVLQQHQNKSDVGKLSAVSLWLLFGAIATQSLSHIFTKMGQTPFNSLEVSFVRLGVGTGALLLIPVAVRALIKDFKAPQSKQLALGQLAFAAFWGTFVAFWLVHQALAFTQAGVVATLGATSPLFVLPFSYWIEKKTIAPAEWIGAGLAFMGVVLLVGFGT
jgi:drug/metabolite transporter (DMT)-like permease